MEFVLNEVKDLQLSAFARMGVKLRNPTEHPLPMVGEGWGEGGLSSPTSLIEDPESLSFVFLPLPISCLKREIGRGLGVARATIASLCLLWFCYVLLCFALILL